jgi:hypothetical protein
VDAFGIVVGSLVLGASLAELTGVSARTPARAAGFVLWPAEFEARSTTASATAGVSAPTLALAPTPNSQPPTPNSQPPTHIPIAYSTPPTVSTQIE